MTTEKKEKGVKDLRKRARVINHEEEQSISPKEKNQIASTLADYPVQKIPVDIYFIKDRPNTKTKREK